MEVKKINDRISVAPQVSAGDMAEAAAMGFKTVVNNRPDGESAGQPASSEIEEAAKAAGLAFVYMPVVSGQLTMQDVESFRTMMAGAEAPILAYCRTGTRCCNLWALAEAPNGSAEDIISQAAGAGYNLSGLGPTLQQLGAK
ncbi:MAG: TIGR01244 family phosphatase [Hyphomicrobiales bacterium]|nr:TIGR01244 family phosphatase [Hyphomicrobiales bacterium]